MLLSLKNVSVNYGTASAVKNVTIEVTEGEAVSVIGTNGAGKSTLMKAISGLVPLAEGEIWFQGRRIDGMAVHAIVKLGVAQVPEGRQLFPYMSVLSNLRLGAYARQDKAQIEKDLEKIFTLFPILQGRRNQKAGTLSGGEQQMLAIGRALMVRPKLLLMDEPSLGLAPLVVEELVDVINDINEMGIGVLLVEQNAGLVVNVAARGYVLEVGKIVLQGDIKQMMANDLVRKAFLGG
jgi:branched-chain amino acid transport system ATP-binding protein